MGCFVSVVLYTDVHSLVLFLLYISFISKIASTSLLGDRNATDWCGGTDLSEEGWVNFTDFGFFAYTWADENLGPYEGNFDLAGGVDMVDFAIFALAWATVDGDAKYNGACDLHYDGTINELDLVIFAENWLSGAG